MNQALDEKRRYGQMAESGGGGGGGKRKRIPPPYDPEELAYLFRELAAASGELFTSETRFLITEESAHDLLTGAFKALAAASESGQLPEIVAQIRKQAPEQRHISTRRMVDKASGWQHLPVYTENEGRDVVKKITDCLVPRSPK